MTQAEGEALLARCRKEASRIAEYFDAVVVLLTYDDEPYQDGDSQTHSFMSYRGELHACIGLAETFIVRGGAVPTGEEDEASNWMAKETIDALKGECTGVLVLATVELDNDGVIRTTFSWAGSLYAMLGVAREFVHMKLRHRDQVEDQT